MKVLFAGGGTGGHIFPAIAIAEALQTINHEILVSFVGTKKKIESRIIPSSGYEFHTIWISGFQRKVSAQNFIFPLKVIVSLLQSVKILKNIKPDAVVGTGGYVCGPVLYAAAAKKIPTIIQEQNSYPGITTRLLASRVDEVHVTFELSRLYLKRAKKIVCSGNPIRAGFQRISAFTARKHFGLDAEKKTLLVFGGSLGASAINTAVLEIIPSLVRNDIQVIWQTGERDFQTITTACDTYKPHVIIRSFIDEMNLAYSACDLTICRAGATSIAELSAIGVPSVLIPYPFATGNHQYENARAMVDTGASRLLPESDIDKLGSLVTQLLSHEDELKHMSDEAWSLGRPDAASAIAHSIIDLIQSRSREAYTGKK